MNRLTAVLVVLLLTFVSEHSFNQMDNRRGKPDLTMLSSDQLKARVAAPKVCGADDETTISKELARRLPDFSSAQLVACFDDWKICGASECQACGWPISDELARRGDPHDLLIRYWTEPKWTIREGIEHVAYHFDLPEVTNFMRRVVTERVKDGEDRYWPVNYLAKKCDPIALNELRSGRYRGQGSLQYQTSVELFGKCGYRPAIPYLVNTALFDFSLNIVIAAEDSLHTLYPDGPKEFNRLEDMQRYFRDRAKKEGFKVKGKLE